MERYWCCPKTQCISILIDRNYDEKMIFKPKYIVKKIGDIYKIIVNFLIYLIN